MKIPETPLVRNMVSMMTLTPHYREDIRLDLQVGIGSPYSIGNINPGMNITL